MNSQPSNTGNQDALIGVSSAETRKRQIKDQAKVEARIFKLTSGIEKKVMCKVLATQNKQIVKIKYLQSLPLTFLEAKEMIQEIVPTAELSSLIVSDPTGDWIQLEDDFDLESMYKVSMIAEQKIIKIQAEFVPIRIDLPLD